MDFEGRLEKAIERGQQQRDSKSREQAEEKMTVEDMKNLHSKCRLELSEYIENCLRKLADHFPGFQFQTVIGDDGWGAKINRDDLALGSGGQPASLYSRMEMVIKPFSSTHIVELSTKGTIQNKEVLSRTHYQFLSQVDTQSFCELIDLWVLEYAEQYSART